MKLKATTACPEQSGIHAHKRRRLLLLLLLRIVGKLLERARGETDQRN
jgi:hypothetical protein